MQRPRQLSLRLIFVSPSSWSSSFSSTPCFLLPSLSSSAPAPRAGRRRQAQRGRLCPAPYARPFSSHPQARGEEAQQLGAPVWSGAQLQSSEEENDVQQLKDAPMEFPLPRGGFPCRPCTVPRCIKCGRHWTPHIHALGRATLHSRIHQVLETGLPLYGKLDLGVRLGARSRDFTLIFIYITTIKIRQGTIINLLIYICLTTWAENPIGRGKALDNTLIKPTR